VASPDRSEFTAEQRLQLLEEQVVELRSSLARVNAAALGLLIAVVVGMTIFFLTNGASP
jgi:hypothetical protein